MHSRMLKQPMAIRLLMIRAAYQVRLRLEALLQTPASCCVGLATWSSIDRLHCHTITSTHQLHSRHHRMQATPDNHQPAVRISHDNSCHQYSGNIVVTASEDSSIKIWHVSNEATGLHGVRASHHSLNQHSAGVFKLAHYSNVLASASFDSSVRYIDQSPPNQTTISRSLAHSLTLCSITDPLHCVADCGISTMPLRRTCFRWNTSQLTLLCPRTHASL
jgi:WD40 repeat protein